MDSVFEKQMVMIVKVAIVKKSALCLIFLILLVSILPGALATDPALGDLSGTSSSDWDSLTTTTITSSSADSYMSSKNPNTNYGGTTSMDVGYGASPKIRRAIVKFDLTSIPSYAYVDLSKVSLYAGTFYQSGGFTVSVHRVQQSPERAWTEAGVTWNTYDGTNSWTTVGGDFNSTATDQISVSSSGYKNWTVTYDVRNFVQTPSTNYGWIFKSTAEASSYAVAFYTKEATSNKPKIYVTYISSPYDIIGKTGVNGLQAGSDSDSLAIAIRLGNFAVSSMTSGDKYEINFTIGAEDFSLMFVATGSSEGKLKLCYKDNGATTWNDGDSSTFSSMSSGTRYQSSSGNIAVKLTDSTTSSYGYIKLEAKRSYLTSLGATGYSVTNIVGRTYQGSSTSTLLPGPQGGTKIDRCPSGTSTASYTMITVPEFPLGMIILAAPLIVIYFSIRKLCQPNMKFGQ